MVKENIDAGIILHEIANFSHLIESGITLKSFSPENSPEALQAEEVIKAGSRRLMETVHSLQTLLITDTYAHNRACMRSFVHRFIGDRHLWQDRGKNIRFINSVGPMDIFDEGLVLTIMRNLLTNALRYAPERSTIEVRVKTCRYETHVTVRNHGSIISKNVRGRLFQAGSKGDQGGSGLGLYISQKCATRMGGRVLCHSSVRMGTAFTFILPRSAPPEKRAAAA